MKSTIISFLKTTLAALLACSLAFAAESGPRENAPQEKGKTAQSAQADTQAARINVNTADSDALQRLPRVGPVIAQRIIEHRQEHGPFKAVDDLVKVSGIGEKTLERLRPLVTVQ